MREVSSNGVKRSILAFYFKFANVALVSKRHEKKKEIIFHLTAILPCMGTKYSVSIKSKSPVPKTNTTYQSVSAYNQDMHET